MENHMKKRWISLYVENQVGVLSKISGLFSGKYVPAVRCNTDLLECIGDTLGNKMFGSRIMVRNKMKKRFLCTQVVRGKPNRGKAAFRRKLFAVSEEDLYP